MRDERGLCIRCNPGEPGEFVGKIIKGKLESIILFVIIFRVYILESNNVFIIIFRVYILESIILLIIIFRVYILARL